MKFKEGDYISFVYDGGSNPGTRRVIYVSNNDGISVYGETVPDNLTRNYYKGKMSDIFVLEPVDFVTAREDIKANLAGLTGEQLAKLYSQLFNKDGCVFNKNTAEILVPAKEEEVLVITNEKTGDKLELSLDMDGVLIGGDYTEEAAEVYDILKYFFGDE